jgi:hypothetical protein
MINWKRWWIYITPCSRVPVWFCWRAILDANSKCKLIDLENYEKLMISTINFVTFSYSITCSYNIWTLIGHIVYSPPWIHHWALPGTRRVNSTCSEIIWSFPKGKSMGEIHGILHGILQQFSNHNVKNLVDESAWCFQPLRWDYDIPNWMESHKIPWFQTSNQEPFLHESNSPWIQCL